MLEKRPKVPLLQAVSAPSESSSQGQEHLSTSLGGPSSSSASTPHQHLLSQADHAPASANHPATAPFLPPSMALKGPLRQPHKEQSQSGQLPGASPSGPRILYTDLGSQPSSEGARPLGASSWPDAPSPVDWEGHTRSGVKHNGVEPAGPVPHTKEIGHAAVRIIADVSMDMSPSLDSALGRGVACPLLASFVG